MAEIHGTLGCLASNGGKDVKDLEIYLPKDLSMKSQLNMMD